MNSFPAADTSVHPPITTDIPFRLDRLPWGPFHWLLVSALGVTWVLDGLEATVIGSIGPTLQKESTLGLSQARVGLAGTIYLAGALLGALVFGYLTDRLGHKRLFTITLAIYLLGALSTACAFPSQLAPDAARRPSRINHEKIQLDARAGAVLSREGVSDAATAPVPGAELSRVGKAARQGGADQRR